MLPITGIFSAGQEGDLCGPMSSDCVWVSERPKLRALAHAAGLRNSGRRRESLAFTLSPHLPSCQSAETLHVDFTYSLLFLPSGNSGLASLFFFFRCCLKKKKARQLGLVHMLRDPQGQAVSSSSPEHGEQLRLRGGQETWELRPPLLSGHYFCTHNLRNWGNYSGGSSHLSMLQAQLPRAPVLSCASTAWGAPG